MSQEVECPSCGKPQKLTTAGKFRQHGKRDDPCEMSGLLLPSHLQKPLPPVAPPVTSIERCYAEGCDNLSGGERYCSDVCEELDTAPPEASTVKGKDVETIPGVDEYGKDLAGRQLDAYKGAADEKGRPYFRAETGFSACDFTCEETMERCQNCEAQYARDTVVSDEYDQPDPLPKESPSEYDQPAKLNRAVTAARPMDPIELQIATMFREIFYQYTNRSRRSQQTTLGPSQVGTPCDRRLVMHFLGAPKVNPGGDGWAAWVGTQIHKGLEDMLKWADAGKGRFAVEQRLKFPSAEVPYGTADAIDRTLFMVDDHKAQGQWAADKLRTSGPSTLYRTQLHVYGMGARQKGERIERVALISWPRDKSNLDDLYVWSESYNPQIARDALGRAERLNQWQKQKRAEGLTPQQVAEAADIADDCRYCVFHLPDAKDLSNGGCNGRQ